jgi:hypothetical protein
MNLHYRTVFLVNAIFSIVFGLAFLVMPAIALNEAGFDVLIPEKFISQFFGATMLTLGLVLWFVKDVTDQGIQKGIGSAMLFGSVLGVVVSAIGLAGGMMQKNGWIVPVVYFLFAIDYTFMLFVQPRMK